MKKVNLSMRYLQGMNNKENRARAASRLLTVLGENCNDIVVLRDERGIYQSGEFRDIDLFSHSLKPYLMSDIWKREAIKQKFSILRIVKRFHYLQFYILRTKQYSLNSRYLGYIEYKRCEVCEDRREKHKAITNKEYKLINR